MLEENLWAEITDDFKARDVQALPRIVPPLTLPQQLLKFTPPPLLEDLWGEAAESHPLPPPLLPPYSPAADVISPDVYVPSTPGNAGRASIQKNAGADSLSIFADDLWSLDEEEPGAGEAPESANGSEIDLPQEAFPITFDLTWPEQEYVPGADPLTLLDPFALLDVEAELAAQERLEAEPLSQQPASPAQPGRNRGHAPGWMSKSSLLYINWEEGVSAEEEAMRRLGYTRLSISEGTRAFVLQAARAYRLTLHQERQMTAQLTAARLRLAELVAEDCPTLERSELEAWIAELESTLVYNLQWLAVKKAPAFLGQGVELDDLIQAGMEGVIAGVRHFDSAKGVRVITAVSWWVFQALARAISEYGRLVRLPIYVHVELSRVKKHQGVLETCLGRLPTQQELADAVQMGLDHLRELLQAPKTILPLSRYTSTEHAHEGYSFQVMEETAFIQGEEALLDSPYQATIRGGIAALLECLTNKERRVIRLRYGLDSKDREKCTLQEVARKLDVTRERVRQIEERALGKLLWHYPASELAGIYPYPQNTKKKK